MSRGYKDLNTHSRRMFSTWRGDGNNDHEAVGRAAAEAAELAGATFHDVPVWAWHWPERDQQLIP